MLKTVEKTGVAALERAISILGAFTPQDRGLTLAQLAERTGLYKSTILRLAVSLERFGYLVRRADGRFVLGRSLFRLGQIYQRSFNLVDFIEPVLQRLSRETGFSASFWIFEGAYRVCLTRTKFSTGRRDLSGNVGERCRLDQGGSASAIYHAFTGDKGARYDKVRRDRIAVSLGEFIPELAAISGPVFERDKLVGTLSLGGFRSQFTRQVVAELGPRIITAAEDLSAALAAGGTGER